MNKEEVLKKARELLKQINSEERKQKARVTESNKEIKEKLRKLIKLARRKRITSQYIAEVLSLTCYGSFVFCCASDNDKKEGLSCEGKNCFWRNSALALLGLSEKDLTRLKEKWHIELTKFLKEWKERKS